MECQILVNPSSFMGFQQVKGKSSHISQKIFFSVFAAGVYTFFFLESQLRYGVGCFASIIFGSFSAVHFETRCRKLILNICCFLPVHFLHFSGYLWIYYTFYAPRLLRSVCVVSVHLSITPAISLSIPVSIHPWPLTKFILVVTETKKKWQQNISFFYLTTNWTLTCTLLFCEVMVSR